MLWKDENSRASENIKTVSQNKVSNMIENLKTRENKWLWKPLARAGFQHDLALRKFIHLKIHDKPLATVGFRHALKIRKNTQPENIKNHYPHKVSGVLTNLGTRECEETEGSRKAWETISHNRFPASSRMQENHPIPKSWKSISQSRFPACSKNIKTSRTSKTWKTISQSKVSSMLKILKTLEKQMIIKTVSHSWVSACSHISKTTATPKTW